MRDEGVGSWPRRRARKTPNRVAIVHDGRAMTYGELDERVSRLARALRGLGVGRGDRVAYLGENHPALLETLFAAGTLGAVFVPLNTRLSGAEIGYMLADSGSSVLVHGAGSQADPAEAAAALPLRTVDVHDGYEAMLARAVGGSAGEPVSLEDPLIMMYTSGTTGTPKGAVLTHGNITWNSVNVLVDVDLAADEVTLVMAPLFHTAALNMTCLPTLLKGGRVLIERGFETGRTFELVERHAVTMLFGVPAMFAALAAAPGWPDADLSSVRNLLCGGSPVPESLIRVYLARGLSFVQGYGMTEASPGALLLDREMSGPKAGSAGVPHFFTDVRVVRPDGTEVGQGERGEVVVRGPNVMSGYWRRPDDTEAALMGDGWFRSGDIAVVDPDGYVSIVDRAKDMIISGGENIYPAEVENVLYGHPDVAECAVIGVPHDRWGEVGKAIVVLRPGAVPDEAALLAFAAGLLGRYKVPKSAVFVTALPRNASGKIIKSRLRAHHGHPAQGGSQA
ncbi:acyl-CoA synthetase [Sphaerisporangium corydalis]|uniref:Long-chain fatty acid--CoA ligase n=1 Tax=Sphaerisporangium corydalis TaxID=1441875 RepID=A0ABV9ET73_9ACTN|nr:long-chain fatty acid--CoA ligase [Sphaerisporangium corydalis]